MIMVMKLQSRVHNIDVKLPSSVPWLSLRDLFWETECIASAIADEIIMTMNYRRFILRDGTIDNWQTYSYPGESLRHSSTDRCHFANGIPNIFIRRTII